ncbi:MAG: sodium:proton antiporter [Atopobiaceae bacterium]|nr:sodium:proton antiporter [Atopobiaceae bacterium]
MLETGTLIVFAVMLVSGIALDLPLLAVLVMGWVLFFDYGLIRGYDMGDLVRMSLRSLSGVWSLLLLFALIGALTASWRAAGTIPAITCWSVRLVTPATLVPASFLLCCVMSALTGSSFAAAATTGVICMTIANSIGANSALVGGAIISGSFFGDQCSPMSSSASLVASLTKTDLFSNVGRMVRTGFVPFVACCALYTVSGFALSSDGAIPQQVVTAVSEAFRSFDLSAVVVLPVLLVFVLCILRVNVRKTMVLSLACALVICVCVQGAKPLDLVRTLIVGYHAADPSIARLADGGGVLSMLDIAAIVAVASTYSGLFEGTALLEGLGNSVSLLARKTTPFVGVLATSIATAAIACDQVVAIMLVRQLCDDCEGANSALALDMESSVALIPALIPWSTSCVGIVAFTGMPMASSACAFFPLLVPAWSLCISLWQHGHPAFVDGAVARAMGLTEEDDARRLAA